MFKVNNKDSKDVFVVNFEHILYLFLLFLLSTLNSEIFAGLELCDTAMTKILPYLVLL